MMQLKPVAACDTFSQTSQMESGRNGGSSMHDIREHHNASVRNHHLLEKQSTYNLNGKVFVVTPVFRKEAPETLGSILFKLMQSEFAQ